MNTKDRTKRSGRALAALALAMLSLSAGVRPNLAHGRAAVPQIIPPLFDLGDAPDSVNNHPGVAVNLAYPGVPGNFPTVWDGATLIAGAGPKHTNSKIAFLGQDISGENDADLAPDADGTLNILNGGVDNSNNDAFDDGWLNPGARFSNCTSVILKVRISRGGGNPVTPMFLNTWFDGNRDGDWSDQGTCVVLPPIDVPIDPPLRLATIKSYEWVVQNQPINMLAIPPGGHLDLLIHTKLVLNATEGQPHWLRFTLSGQHAITPTLSIAGTDPLPDGRGVNPPAMFLFGETEDYRQTASDAPPPGTLTIVKTAIAPANPHGGDPVNYRIDLEHVGGIASALSTIRDRLPDGVGFVGPIDVTALSGTVSPLSASIVSGTVEWNGELSPGAKVRLTIPVRIDPCVGANKSIVNIARALNTDGNVIDATQTLNVACSPPPNVDVKKEVLRLTDVSTPTAVVDQAILPGDDLLFRITARNNGAEAVVVFVHDRMPEGVRATASGDPEEARGRLEVAPGQTESFDIPAHVASRCDIGRVITNTADFTAVPGTRANVSAFDLPPTLPRGTTNQVTLHLGCHDLGDAPDSTNHFGAAMAAYPGVQGNFPTVFDAATGADQGPLHRNPIPFHLGQQFSIEAEADIGPDQDGAHNIAVLNNNPDNDRKDDGIRVGQLVLSDCVTTSVPVQVSIGPDAAAFFAAHVGNGTGYLNVWLDGNRDGDWSDVGQCRTDSGGNRPAFEHIVIDHQVSLAALGAGSHIVNVPTRLLPWPVELANRPAWLRFTLSEAPSNKPLVLNGFNYGDGRGIAPPFVTGETEDYLWRPVPQADVAIQKRGAMRTDINTPITGTASADDHVVWQIRYANLGGADATNVVITDDLTQAGNKATFVVTSVPSVPHTLSGNTLTFNIGTLPAGAEGVIMVELARQLAGHIYTNTVTISATNDTDASNNNAQAQIRHKFLQPPIILNPLDGTTCDGIFTGARTLLGITTEFAVVDLYVDGVLTATLNAGGSGYFRHDMVLPDGPHTLHAVARLNGHESIGAERLIIVNRALSFDPISLRFIDSVGRHFRPTDGNGRTDESGWSVHLAANSSYTATVRLCCESPTAQVTLNVSGSDLALTDPDGDDVYQGAFSTTAAGPVTATLTVECDGVTNETQSQVLIDPEGVVSDRNTGAPLSGAQTVCLQQDAAGAGYSVWPAENFGQINPQTTLANGYFSFWTPMGVYRIDVNKAGYQPYRSPDLQVISTPVRHDVALTPLTGETPQITIAIGEGGLQPANVKVPPGAVIAFVNTDTRERGVRGLPGSAGEAHESGVAAVAGSFDSGALGAAQRYTVKLSAPGSYRLIDIATGEVGGEITVEGPSSRRVLLPLAARN